MIVRIHRETSHSYHEEPDPELAETAEPVPAAPSIPVGIVGTGIRFALGKTIDVAVVFHANGFVYVMVILDGGVPTGHLRLLIRRRCCLVLLL